MPTYTLEELKKHKSKDSCWLLIHGKIYDVTQFAEEHPGGEEILFESGGKDATQDFEDVGHSPSAEDLMEKYYIGDLAGATQKPKSEPKKDTAPTLSAAKKAQASESGLLLSAIPFFLIIGISVYVKFFMDKIN